MPFAAFSAGRPCHTPVQQCLHGLRLEQASLEPEQCSLKHAHAALMLQVITGLSSPCSVRRAPTSIGTWSLCVRKVRHEHRRQKQRERGTRVNLHVIGAHSRQFGAVTGCLVAYTIASVISNAPVTTSRPREQRVHMKTRTHRRDTVYKTHIFRSHKMISSGLLLPDTLLRDVSALLLCCVARCVCQSCGREGSPQTRNAADLLKKVLLFGTNAAEPLNHRFPGRTQMLRLTSYFLHSIAVDHV